MDAWQTATGTITRCLGLGVREFVACGGARNALLIEAAARAEKAGLARIWRHADERSAGFFALGRCMASAEPCAVLTTSGTAAAELLPAIIEAGMQARPLVAVTADRPEHFLGSGAPQTIDQRHLFGPYAARDAETWNGEGPLHLNIALEEGFSHNAWEPAAEALRPFRAVSRRPDVASLARWLRADPSAALLVLVGGLEPEDREEVYHFCMALDAPVVAEASSGLREALQDLAPRQRDRFLRQKPPAKVLRLGEVPCLRFWRDLESLEQVSVRSVCRNGLPGLARTRETNQGGVAQVLRALGEVEPIGDPAGLLEGAAARAARIEELLESFPDSEPALVRATSHFASLASGVFLGNSLPIREWDLFSQWMRPVPEVRANRGANGIDGQISTWLGWSAERTDAWALVGDLTALYDANAWFVGDRIRRDGRVLAVIQNRGGRIFERLPGMESMLPRTVECMTNPHDADLSGLARLWGIEHLAVRRADDLDAIPQHHAGLLLELLPDPDQTRSFWNAWDA